MKLINANNPVNSCKIRILKLTGEIVVINPKNAIDISKNKQ